MIKYYSNHNTDCLRACISSIIKVDLKDFPNLDKYWFSDLYNYIYKKGFNISHCRAIDNNITLNYYIAVYKNPWEDLQYHAVVCKNNKIIHNPSINDKFDYTSINPDYFILINKIKKLIIQSKQS